MFIPNNAQAALAIVPAAPTGDSKSGPGLCSAPARPLGRRSCPHAVTSAPILTFQHRLYGHGLFCDFNIDFKNLPIWTLQLNWRHLQEKDSYFHTIFIRFHKFSWFKYVVPFTIYTASEQPMSPVAHFNYLLLESTVLRSLILMLKKDWYKYTNQSFKIEGTWIFFLKLKVK